MTVMRNQKEKNVLARRQPRYSFSFKHKQWTYSLRSIY